MKYPKEYLEEIKSRLKVSTVVSRSVNLKKRGKEFIGISPFTNEKTPSFTVNDQKGFYHCFSSHEHGNIFDFLMKTKNYKFGEAVKILAVDAGMQPYRFTKQDEEKQNRWKIYNTILEKYVNLSLKYNIAPATFANAFVNDRSFVTSNIIGATSLEQLKENIDSINIHLSQEILDEIQEIHSYDPNPCV